MRTKKKQQLTKTQSYNALMNTAYQPTTARGRRRILNEQREPLAETEEKKRWWAWTWKKGVLLVLLAMLTPFLIIGVWDLRNFSNASSKLFGTSNAFGILAQTPPKQTDGHTNILLVGYSVDDAGHAGATLTDSIMILSLNKDEKSGYMLSIPRDLYINIPGEGRAKINEAYQDGENSGFSEEGYPNGGIGLLQKTITENMGIDIHNYAIINYGSVRDIVDALGGVTVHIESPDPRGIYDPNFQPHEGGPLQLANGPQKVDGQTALRLTRARGATYGSYGFPQSDLNRIQNQQKVLTAIKTELNWTLVLDPRTNGKIFNAVGNNVQTNVKLSEVIPLYRMFVSVPESQLKSVSLAEINGQRLLRGYQTPYGQSALIPTAGINNYQDIQAAIQSL
jgi:LCP family protein required for cell wall assembly